MEEARRMDNVHPAPQRRPHLVLLVKNVGGLERGLQAAAIFEESLGEVEEAGLEVNGYAVACGGAVMGELANVLCETAA